MRYSLKQRLGAAALDVPRYEWWLRRSWVRICNRNERLRTAPKGHGVSCQWQWTSDLHAAKVFPSLGARLLKRATTQWPIVFADAPHEQGPDAQVSFVIGHRGRERVPHLLATLATIAAQQRVRCECIVVEQSAQSEVCSQLPRWVRYVHTPLPAPDMPYSRAWALNVGARVARGKVVVLHDNDLLVPAAYAAELWDRYSEGWQVVNLKRFIFYLTANDSKEIESAHRLGPAHRPEVVMQNAEAGGSIAIAREALFAIGGYDESFVGWGGEDSELWERAQTLRVWPYGYLPLVHLWHPPQSEKWKDKSGPRDNYRSRSALPVGKRIEELRRRSSGEAGRMDPPWAGVSRDS